MKDWGDKITPSSKEMRSIWHISLTSMSEKKYGKHSTQKTIELLKKIISSSTNENETENLLIY